MKKTFKVRVTERLERVVEVEAENLNEAVDQVQRDYDNNKIVLDWSDLPVGSEEIVGVDEE